MSDLLAELSIPKFLRDPANARSQLKQLNVGALAETKIQFLVGKAIKEIKDINITKVISSCPEADRETFVVESDDITPEEMGGKNIYIQIQHTNSIGSIRIY